MGLAEAKADLKIAAEQIATASSVDELKTQLLDNLLPCIEGVADAARDEIAQRDEVISGLIEDVDGLVDDRGDILMPETAGKLLALLELGDRIGKELEATLKSSKDEVTKKRCAGLLKSYRQGVRVRQEEIAAMTVPIEEEEPQPQPGQPADPEEEDEDDDEEEGDDGDEYEDADEDEDEDEDDDEGAAARGGK